MKLTFNDYLVLCFLLLFLGGTEAYAFSTMTLSDSLVVRKDSGNIPLSKQSTDSVRWMRRGEPLRLFKQKAGKNGSFFQRFNEIDTSYIEPQKYNFAFMLQNTNTYEVYRLSSSKEQSITFAPEATVRIGPYFGWRWIFLGYTLDIKHLDFWNKNNNPRQEYDLSLYSSMLGLDIYYRKTGNDYKIRQLYLDVNWGELNRVISNRLGSQVPNNPIDSTLMFSEVKYTDISISGGYAYNWVFARNWVLAGSLSLALAYKRSTGDVTHRTFSISDFKFNNINVDGIGRFGVVWNNSKWYVGTSTILHAYNYRRSNFSTNNFFGSINLYAGFNFGRKKGK